MKEAVSIGQVIAWPKVKAVLDDYSAITESKRKAIRAHDEERIALIKQRAEADETARKCAEHEKRWTDLCPVIYRDTNVDELPDQPATMKVLAWTYQERGMLLHGPTRAGKSRSAWLLMRQLHDAGRSIMAFDGIGWFIKVGAAFREIEKADLWLDSLTRVDVLFLDDIFRGRMTDAQDLALWGVMERRTSNRRPVIITTNATSEVILTNTGEQMEPIIERMREFCDDVVFARQRKAVAK